MEEGRDQNQQRPNGKKSPGCFSPRGNDPNCFETEGLNSSLICKMRQRVGWCLDHNHCQAPGFLICLIFHSNKASYSSLLERSPGERNLLRCEGQGFRRSQEDSTRGKPHMPPAQASCEQALATSTGVGTAQQAYSPLWPTNGAVCTPHMQVLTL